MRVKQVMRTEFPTLKKTDGIEKVVELFKKGSRIIPIIEKNKCVGEVDEIDLLKIVVDPKKVPEELIISFGADFGFYAKKVGDLTTSFEIVLDPEDNAQEAALKLLEQGLTDALVLDGSKVVGVVSVKDFLKVK